MRLSFKRLSSLRSAAAYFSYRVYLLRASFGLVTIVLLLKSYYQEFNAPNIRRLFSHDAVWLLHVFVERSSFRMGRRHVNARHSAS